MTCIQGRQSIDYFEDMLYGMLDCQNLVKTCDLATTDIANKNIIAVFATIKVISLFMFGLFSVES